MTRKTGPSSFAYFHLQHFPNFTKPRFSISPLDKIRDDIPKYPGAAVMGESFAEGPASRGVFVILKDVNMVFGQRYSTRPPWPAKRTKCRPLTTQLRLH